MDSIIAEVEEVYSLVKEEADEGNRARGRIVQFLSLWLSFCTYYDQISDENMFIIQERAE